VAADIPQPSRLVTTSSGTPRVFAWALFDLANTFFAVAMLSFFFPLWITEDLGARELTYSVAVGISMGGVALIMPFCGALSDATGERMRYLRWTTYGCAVATCLIGLTGDLWTALALFIVANICYQLGTVFYDALLASLVAPDRLGQTSGLGAAFGYLGSLVGLLALWPFVRAGGHSAAFIPSAAFFLLLALPCFFILRDPPRSAPISWGAVGRDAGRRLLRTVRAAQTVRGVWRYLWAWFASMNAINTVLYFMVVYTRKVVGLSFTELIQFFVLCQIFTILGALAFSRLIPRWGAKRTLGAIWAGWIGALALVAVNPSMSWLWIAGPIMGFCLGSTFATSRVLLIELSPADQLGEMFGLAGLFGRASSIIGPVVWGVLVGGAGTGGYRQGFLFLIGLLAIGLWLLRRVPAPPSGARA